MLAVQEEVSLGILVCHSFFPFFAVLALSNLAGEIREHFQEHF